MDFDTMYNIPYLINLYDIIHITVSIIPNPNGKMAPNVYVIPRTKPSRYSGRYSGIKNDNGIIAIII